MTASPDNADDYEKDLAPVGGSKVFQYFLSAIPRTG